MQPHDPPQEWIDEKQVTRIFGITHTPLYTLRKRGAIRSLSLRGEGQTYGKRLFNVASIREFLAGQENRELAECPPASDRLAAWLPGRCVPATCPRLAILQTENLQPQNIN